MDTRRFNYSKLAICALLVIAAQAYGNNLNVSILPPNPTSQNVVSITMYGMWSTSCCPPNASTVIVSGNNIYFGLTAPSICILIVCDPIFWQQTQYVGPLSPGVYTLWVHLNDSMYTPVTQFTVSGPLGPTERNVPSQYATIQAAINASNNGDTVIVSPGTYTGDGNRDIDFLGKAITVRSTDSDDPCIVAATIIDCQGNWPYGHRGFNFHSGEGINSILDGITIKNGLVWNENGGGILCQNSSPMIRNCIITNNSAQMDMLGGGSGGGIYCYECSPMVINCTITNNVCSFNGGGIDIYYGAPVISNCIISNNAANGGGGIACIADNAVITNCVITGNQISVEGAGIYSGQGSNASIYNCTFTQNSGPSENSRGGGIACVGSSPRIGNCLIADCTASYSGGGIYCADGANPAISGCTIVYNHAAGWWTGTFGRGGGIYCYHSDPNITDSILWANTAQTDGPQIALRAGSAWPSTLTVSYCDIQGGQAEAYIEVGCSLIWLSGNIVSDPYFVTGPLGNYYLSQNAAGQSSNSPCVDAGSDTAENLNMNSLTTSSNQMHDTGIVDMGYHYPIFMVTLDSDLDNNLFVDFLDYAFMSRNWQLIPDPCDAQSGDIIKDGIVNIYDLAKFCADWLACFVTKANNPIPADHAVDVSTNVILQWSPGENAVSHDVYFGTDFNMVNNANNDSLTVYMGNQDANFWDTNNYASTGLIAYTNYYWRIDEVAGCTAKGDVWSFTTLPDSNIDTNLVGWWKFDEVDGLIAYDSAGTNDGTLHGNPQWATGQIGGALEGDGNGDYVQIPDNTSLTPSNAITIAFWLYNRDGTAGIYKYADCPDQTGHGSPGNSRAYAFSVSSAGASLLVCQTRSTMDSISSISTVSLNQWHHLAATFDQGQAYIYIDGQLDNSKLLSVTSIMNDAQPLIIGGFWEYCTPSFYNRLNGRADDVRIYNRALTMEEIAILYQQGL
jgi:parallel beta-helix repeat protein